MLLSAGKLWGNYNAVEVHSAFRSALASSIAQPIDLLVQSIVTGPNHLRGTWVHPQLAIHLASWCSPTFAVKVTELVLRYMSGQVTTAESLAAAKRVNDCATPVINNELDEETRALKRLKLLNEIEMEKVKHGNDIARLRTQFACHPVHGLKGFQRYDCIDKESCPEQPSRHAALDMPIPVSIICSPSLPKVSRLSMIHMYTEIYRPVLNNSLSNIVRAGALAGTGLLGCAFPSRYLST